MTENKAKISLVIACIKLILTLTLWGCFVGQQNPNSFSTLSSASKTLFLIELNFFEDNGSNGLKIKQ